MKHQEWWAYVDEDLGNVAFDFVHGFCGADHFYIGEEDEEDDDWAPAFSEIADEEVPHILESTVFPLKPGMGYNEHVVEVADFELTADNLVPGYVAGISLGNVGRSDQQEHKAEEKIKISIVEATATKQPSQKQRLSRAERRRAQKAKLEATMADSNYVEVDIPEELARAMAAAAATKGQVSTAGAVHQPARPHAFGPAEQLAIASSLIEGFLWKEREIGHVHEIENCITHDGAIELVLVFAWADRKQAGRILPRVPVWAKKARAILGNISSRIILVFTQAGTDQEAEAMNLDCTV